MKPLSIYKYYSSNKKKFLSAFISICLSVFLLYTVQMLIDSTFRTEYQIFVEPQKYYSSITAKASTLDRELVSSLEALDSVDAVLPWVFHYTNFFSSIGGNTGTRVFTINHEDMLTLMKTMGLKLKEGRLPQPGTNEIALHYLVAANKKIAIGDKLGSNYEKDEVLQGERVVTGLIEGSSIVSFESLEYWLETNHINSSDRYKFGVILLPKEGAMASLNKYLESLPAPGMEVRTLSLVSQQNQKSVESIRMILTAIDISVIVIVSLCVGFLCYIYFYQRKTEFGLLGAIGYSRQQVINRAFAEISVMNFSGFALGIILSILVGTVLNNLIFLPKGQSLMLLNLNYAAIAFSIPLFVTIFSIIPVWRMLKKLDPISIIEGVTVS